MIFGMKHFKMEQAGEPAAGGSSTGEPVPVTTAITEPAAPAGGEPAAPAPANTAPEELDVSSLPQAAQDLIKTLRTENADRRTKNNNLTTRFENIESGLRQMFGGDDQELTPEQTIEQMSGQNETLSYQNAVMGMAYENSIPMENYEYFSFLMEKEVNGLEEGQELSEDSLLSVIQKAKGFAATSVEATNTSVDGDGTVGDPGSSAGVTLESFASMSIVQKSELYRKSPEVYNGLMKQARQKKLL